MTPCISMGLYIEKFGKLLTYKKDKNLWEYAFLPLFLKFLQK